MRQVIVVPHDPNWPRAFEIASAEIAEALGDNLVEIHHIGSTSIPGIHAKPIIDILPLVADIAMLDQQSERMVSLGYEARGEFGIVGRRYFPRNDAAGVRTHHVHAFQIDSPEVLRHLAFRDFMRAHGELASQYGDLKRRLAEAHPHDRDAYMDGKDGFIQEMQSRALAWVAAGRPSPS